MESTAMSPANDGPRIPSTETYKENFRELVNKNVTSWVCI